MATPTLLKPETPPAPVHDWQYLEARPHPWRRQLYVIGQRLRAFAVWSDMIANQFTAEEIAQSRGLTTEAFQECLWYCEKNRRLLTDEAEQEKEWLLVRGVKMEPSTAGCSYRQRSRFVDESVVTRKDRKA